MANQSELTYHYEKCGHGVLAFGMEDCDICIPCKDDQIATLIAQLAKLRGPECATEDCPDYDGEHPYHNNVRVQAWEKSQKELVGPLQDQLVEAKRSAEIERCKLGTACELADEYRDTADQLRKHEAELTKFWKAAVAELSDVRENLTAQLAAANEKVKKLSVEMTSKLTD